MPRAVFESLKTKCENEMLTVKSALEKAESESTPQIDYEETLLRLHQVIDALNDESISAVSKNALIKSVVERIEYSKQPSIRMSKEEAMEKGLTSVNGWCIQDIKLDIHLKI